MENESKKWMSAVLHVLVWLTILVIFLFFELNSPTAEGFKVRAFIVFAALIVQFYAFYFYFTPAYFLKRKYGLFALSVIGFLALVALIPDFHKEPMRPEHLPDFERMRDMMPNPRMRPKGAFNPMRFLGVLISAMTILFSVIVRTTNHLAGQDKRRKETENKQLQTELSLLKNQISPHFFFNTLNTIYALTQTNPEKAGESVLQLSKMMRFLLYESENSPVIPIKKEVELMETYLNLVRDRLTENVDVKFDVALENEQFKVPALLFIPLIENAFKHGVSTSKPSFIHISLAVKNDVLNAKISNSVHPKANDLEKGGIGLSNVKRRLELMCEREDYSLDISDDGATYNLELTLKPCL